MSVAAALIGGAIGAFGKKPKVPKLKDIIVGDVQKNTILDNIASLADVANLAAGVNTFNQEQLTALIDKVLPGARQQIEKNIGAQLRGEIPEDVLTNLRRSQSERSAGALTQGSQFSLGQELSRQLGMSLALTQQGLSSAESWLARAAAPQFDVTTMFFTPQQRLAHEVQQQGVHFNRDMIAAQVKAAPDPKTAALGQEIDRLFNTFAGVGMMALGGSMGGGMGGMAGGAGAAGGAGGGMGGLGGFGGMGAFSGVGMGGGGRSGGGAMLGTAGGQGVGIMQSDMGNFYQNWASKYGW